ncbi:MAG: PEGA domain-containing protein [Phycisphaerales bacterium]|nr:PEGA domain-containing protein [Phycisphaerales bacterium]
MGGRQGVQIGAMLLIAATLGGCVERQIRVTSSPSGARVWLNDQEIGVTPCDARFTFYGKYDVRLEKNGYEAIHEMRRARTPVHEYPGIDLVATALPTTVSNTVRWHFDLDEVAERTGDPDTVLGELISRAQEFRGNANETDPR